MERQISSVVERHLTNVRESGEGYLRATCPFHTSRSSSRSFLIHRRSGWWVCYGCHKSGPFTQLLQAFGYHQAQIDRLIGEAEKEIVLPERLEKIRVLQHEWSVLPEYILAAYRHCPTPLLALGFKEDTLLQHDVGYDARENRITFAIRDLYGRLVAISGRACDPHEKIRYKVYDAKPPHGALLNVIENYVADNRRHLYGFHTVYPARAFSEEAPPPLIIVEGYKGALWLRQGGFVHTVALQGSSMTRGQEMLLSRVQGPYYVLLDHEPGKNSPDAEGNWAAMSIARRLAPYGRALICQYDLDKKERTSPDDLTPAEIAATLENAQSPGQLRLHWHTARTTAS